MISEAQTSTASTVMSNSISLRDVRPADFETVLPWMYEDGWPVNENICQATYDWDRKGWLVAVDTSTGEIVGNIVGTSLDDNTASICMFIVHPRRRHQGIGNRLWAACLEYLSQKNIMINALESAASFYAERGFIHQDFTTKRFKGEVRREKIEASELEDTEFLPYQEDKLAELSLYDATIHQVSRQVFLEQFLDPGVATTILARRGRKIIGYGSFQRAPTNSKFQNIGPVFADDPEVAKALLNKLLCLFGEDDWVAFDTCCPPPDVVSDFAKLHRLQDQVGSQLLRLYNKHPLRLPFSKVFAVTTLGTSSI